MVLFGKLFKKKKSKIKKQKQPFISDEEWKELEEEDDEIEAMEMLEDEV